MYVHVVQNALAIAKHGEGQYVLVTSLKVLEFLEVFGITDGCGKQQFGEVHATVQLNMLGIIKARLPGVYLDDEEALVLPSILTTRVAMMQYE